MGRPRIIFLILTTLLQGTLCADLCKLRDQGIIKIPENITVGSVVGSMDVIGNIQEVSLETMQNGYFSLNVPTREIILTAALDFENQQKFRYTVKCRQQNPSIQVDLFRIIALTDINDNTPVFNSNHYYVNVSEATPVNSIIFRGVSATDADATNLFVQYDVMTTSPFHDYIDFERASQGEVTLKKQLDYETLQEFTVQILVLDTPQDAAAPRRSAIANLTVLVQNEDDMDPAFTKDHYDASISTSTPMGTLISTGSTAIRAEDQDLHFKSPIVYSIWEFSDAFRMDNVTAEIWLQKPLDAGRYTALLKAVQTDNPSRRTVSTLTVTVFGGNVDQNRPPTFLQRDYDVKVFENTPVNQIIASVPAVDPDFGAVLAYRLANDQSGLFSITSKGDIQLLKPLDFETTQSYVLELSVTDSEFTSSATVNIMVMDVNDNNPVIAHPDIFVDATREHNSLLATVEASDMDQSSKLSYSMVGGDRLFSVSDVGEVYMTGQVKDFPLSQYSLVVIVRDNGDPPRQASAHIMVRLPYMLNATNVTEIPSNAAVKEEANEVVPIVLGILAAILLFVVIVLVILLIRRKKRHESPEPQIENETESNNRRAFQDENLEKVKQPSHIDPEGLAYRPTGKPANGFPSSLDLNLDPEHGETEDGATTIQDNPISGINHAYSGSDVSEVGNDMGDIRIQTSMTPYNNNGYPGFVENDLYGAGDLKTFRHSGSSNESLSSDSTPGSKKQLVKPDLMEHGKPNSRPFSWNNLNGSTAANSNGDIPSDGRLSADEKPEITVYF